MKAKVRCTVWVEVCANPTSPFFEIMDNGCPGVGVVGKAIEDAIERGEESGECWACDLGGINRVVHLEGNTEGQDIALEAAYLNTDLMGLEKLIVQHLPTMSESDICQLRHLFEAHQSVSDRICEKLHSAEVQNMWEG